MCHARMDGLLPRGPRGKAGGNVCKQQSRVADHVRKAGAVHSKLWRPGADKRRLQLLTKQQGHLKHGGGEHSLLVSRRLRGISVAKKRRLSTRAQALWQRRLKWKDARAGDDDSAEDADLRVNAVKQEGMIPAVQAVFLGKRRSGQVSCDKLISGCRRQVAVRGTTSSICTNGCAVCYAVFSQQSRDCWLFGRRGGRVDAGLRAASCVKDSPCSAVSPRCDPVKVSAVQATDLNGGMQAAALAPARVVHGGSVPAADWTQSEKCNKVISNLEQIPLPTGAAYWNLKEACKIAATLGYGKDWHGGFWREIQPFLPTRPSPSDNGEEVYLAASRSTVSKAGQTHVHVRGKRCPLCLAGYGNAHAGAWYISPDSQSEVFVLCFQLTLCDCSRQVCGCQF